MYIDLRKVLGKISKWDDLAWDGTQVLAIYRNKVADRATHLALTQALTGITPLTAGRVKRTLIISSCDREQAVREITAGYLVVANIAIDEVLQQQPLGILIKLLQDPHTLVPIQQRAQAILHVKTSCAVNLADQTNPSGAMG